ncbi:MAG: carbamoyltransferase HypF [Vibrio sp.]
MNVVRRFITVTGIVQGVGFRPFVYQTATQLGLVGWVCNSTGGVKIELQGHAEHIQEFISLLETNPPPLARIDHIEIVEQDIDNTFIQFEIIESHEQGDIHIDVSPDKTTCAACRDDILNPQSRFYQYPFTNCTHCGPRYTIIKQLPYDRPYTSMSDFAFCPTCEQEYRDPMNRRYHAQPISCPECGPQLSYFSDPQNLVAEKNEALTQAVQSIQSGGVVAIKGLGGFHLVCDASSHDAVEKLRQLKQRQRKPFAVMVADESIARRCVIGDKAEWQTLTCAEAPIVLMKLNQEDNHRSLIAENVAHTNPYLGLMLPYTPLHILLFDELKKANATQSLVMTSANRSGIPLATDIQDVWLQFSDPLFAPYLDGVLDHNRPIVQACDDSLVQVVNGQLRILRLARGYAPMSFALDQTTSPNIAVGAQQKSVFAMADQQHWMLSPYIGELDDLDTQARFDQTVQWFQQLYHCDDPALIGDKHPQYFSTEWMKEKSQNIQQIQHHYAHILSVMAEHKLTKKVLGIALDGTGFGDDETIWGGEVILADVHAYQRIGHVRPFRLIGRHKAIQEPARILYALLLEAYSPDEIQAMQLKAFEKWSSFQFENLYQLWQSETHSPQCTSTGRLFDAWAVLLGLLTHLDYEGESGLLIEAGAYQVQSAQTQAVELDFAWQLNGGVGQLDWMPMLKQTIQLVAQVESSEKQAVKVQASQYELLAMKNQLCHGFCFAWAKAIFSICQAFPDYDVALSGGVFQNRVLVEAINQLELGLLAEKSSKVSDRHLYFNQKIPTNDAGIAAGQIWYAIHQV